MSEAEVRLSPVFCSDLPSSPFRVSTHAQRRPNLPKILTPPFAYTFKRPPHSSTPVARPHTLGYRCRPAKMRTAPWNVRSGSRPSSTIWHRCCVTHLRRVRSFACAAPLDVWIADVQLQCTEEQQLVLKKGSVINGVVAPLWKEGTSLGIEVAGTSLRYGFAPWIDHYF